MAGAGAGGDLPTGEMSTEKELFNAINPGKTLEKFTKLLKGYSGDWAALTDTWSEGLFKGDTLLMRAVRNNHTGEGYLKFLRALLAAGAPINQVSKKTTALHFAITHYSNVTGLLEFINLLYEHILRTGSDKELKLFQDDLLSVRNYLPQPGEMGLFDTRILQSCLDKAEIIKQTMDRWSLPRRAWMEAVLRAGQATTFFTPPAGASGRETGPGEPGHTPAP